MQHMGGVFVADGLDQYMQVPEHGAVALPAAEELCCVGINVRGGEQGRGTRGPQGAGMDHGRGQVEAWEKPCGAA
jgi:hypothetical protein